ncbi:protein of unknown function [Malonomonas rubra DSM 5091]|uniref:NFACT RNA-binding domain-containing protein n=1 Tax=Malonomonas rubra DSM 5091 TaxID=1122189 RepID=A0A1M6D977_MALRU|nr:NFACT family protein [Malonomonas rubra]SHI69763.1 protein of unknown function [Malonomonas rubra DSM 5091]
MNVEQVRQLVAELKDKIAGSRVTKIHQPTTDMLLFRLWTGEQNLRLQIIAAALNGSIQLTEENYPNPFTPPRFCQLLRARVSRIVDVQQLNDDRVVEFQCQGGKGDCRLIVELTGRSSNLVFVDNQGKIIDLLKRQREGRLQLGTQYTLPEKRDESLGQKNKKADGENAGSEKDLKNQLMKLLAKEKKKLSKRLVRIEQEYRHQQDYERYQQLGNLLLANLHLIEKGTAKVQVLNYYLDPAVEESIALDPQLSPQDNADKYFRRYKKYRRGIEHSERRLAETREEQEWLEDLNYQLESAEQPNDISVVADLMKKSGLLKEKVSRLPRGNNQQQVVKELLSPGGRKVVWGSNSRQNDMISTKLLKKGDLWFHAYRCPGSHVLLKGEGGKAEFSAADIEFAAAIAAGNCKAKNDSKVEVMVAEAKAVKKPPGAKPGMVTVQQYKTLVVKPFSL